MWKNEDLFIQKTVFREGYRSLFMFQKSEEHKHDTQWFQVTKSVRFTIQQTDTMKTIFIITSLFLLLPYCICDDLALGVNPNCQFAGSNPASTRYSNMFGVSYSRTFLLTSFITPNETYLSLSVVSLNLATITTSNVNLTVNLVLLDNNHLPDTVITSFTETIPFNGRQYYNFTYFKNYTLLPLQPYGLMLENRECWSSNGRSDN